jgi:hypothetical protein
MLYALIFTISIIALAQFALYYWRAALIGVGAPSQILGRW